MAKDACPSLMDAVHKNSRVDWSDGLISTFPISRQKISIRFENSRSLLSQYYLTERPAGVKSIIKLRKTRSQWNRIEAGNCKIKGI
jgi:hypothetical protein